MNLLFRNTIILFALMVALSAKGQHENKVYDSAVHAFDRGELKRARILLEGKLATSNHSAEATRHFLLLGSVREEQGYLPAALEAYRNGEHLATEYKMNRERAAALNGIARMQTAIGHYDSVILRVDLSRQLDTTTVNNMMVDQVEGKYWQAQNQYDKALLALQRALDRSTKIKDNKNTAIILSSMGSIYFSHNPDMSVALDYYRRSNQYYDSLKPSPVLIRNYCRIANAYMVQGNLKNAEHYLLRARQLVEDSGYLQLKAYVLSSWAILLTEKGQVKEAADFSDEPIRIKRELGDNRQLQNDLLNVGEMRMMIGQYDKAKELTTEGIAVSHSLHDIVYLKYFYNQLSQLDSIRGDFKSAYTNFKKSEAYKDSSFSVDHLRSVNEIKEKYEAEQKEKIIAEKELQIEAQKYQRAMIIGVSVTAMLVLVVILILVKSKSRGKLQQEKQLRLQMVVQTQEDVQQRIARDLHDGLVQVLGAAQMSLESVSDDTNVTLLQKQMRIASGIMDEAVTEARSISHQILPYSLLKGGLLEALDELLSRSFEKYTFHKPLNPINASESEAINIYRIVQELVNNVRKHAEAKQITLSLNSTKNEIKLIFEDDGKGFLLTDPAVGVGLSNMKTRAELLGGKIMVHSEVSKGTRVELIIPR